MKSFCKEILLFVIFIFIVLKLIKCNVPYYWGNYVIRLKLEYLKNRSTLFDTYFVGSSTIHRHIDPIVFDYITGKKSYNLGSAGMNPLERDYIVEHFLSNNDFQDSVDIFFQEVDYTKIDRKNLHTIRTNYCLDFKRTKKAVLFFYEKKQFIQILYHLSGFLENQFCINQLVNIMQFYMFTHKYENKKVMDTQKGFHPLDQLEKINIDYSRRHKDFLKNVKENGFEKIKKPIEIKIINTLLSNKSIFIFWQIQGNPVSNYKYYFDKSHYNATGARIYTKEIGQKVIAQ